MAIVNHDVNTQQNENTTNVLGNSGTNVSTQQQSSNYVSNGNPYGEHSPNTNIITTNPSTSNVGSSGQSSPRKQNTGASSGSFTNVQSYIDKNKGSSQQLAGQASKTLTNTANIAKENLNKTQQGFQGQVGAGSLQNKDTALNEANTAFNEAAGQQAATQQFNNASQARMYDPNAGSDNSQRSATGNFGKEDPADSYLKEKNLARVIYGDGTHKDFENQIDATKSIEEYNARNPGYYSYGEEQELSTGQDRLKDILNAEYKGPTDLSEAVGYDQAYNTIQDASALQNQALNTGNQNELLKRTFSTGQNEYNTGNQLLDNLLLGQGEANKTFRGTAEKLGESATGLLTDDLKTAQTNASKLAQQETSDLQRIRQEARQDLTNVGNERQQQVEGRINDVVANWDKYPQHFRDLFSTAVSDYNESKEGKATYDQKINNLNSIVPNIANSPGNNITEKVDNYIKSSPASKYTPEDLTELKSIQSQIDYLNKDLNQMRLGSTPAYKQAQLAEKRLKRQELDDYVREKFNIPENIDTYTGRPIVGYAAQNALKQYDQLEKLKESATDASQYEKFSTFNPDTFDMKLSQMEAEALGVKGGEGLYNLLQDSIKGTSGQNTIENLLKTAQSDRNQLVSRDEQSQLNRLQQLAGLANDYGSADSGINYRNSFTNADLAGQQNALSALDMQNFGRLVQGAEKNFRDDASTRNISGYGEGSGSSGGAFGTKRASASRTYSQNIDDLINRSGGYRNMYDPTVDNNLLSQVVNSARGNQEFSTNWENSDFGDMLGDMSNFGSDALKNMTGNSTLGNVALWSNPLTAPIMLAGAVGNWAGGSKAEAQQRADAAAHINAEAALRSNLSNYMKNQGVTNQFSVVNDQNRNNELLNLILGLDTTNL